MGKIKYALPISLFRKIVYIVCIFVLPLYFDIQYIFYAGTVSDAIGATFSVIVFFLIINPRLKRDMNYSAAEVECVRLLSQVNK